MTRYEKNVRIRPVLVACVALAMLTFQACVTGTPKNLSLDKYERLLGAPLQDRYLRSAIDRFQLEPLDSSRVRRGEKILRVVDASSWGYGVTTARLTSSPSTLVGGEIFAESWDPDSRRKARAHRALNAVQVRTFEQCLKQLRRADVFAPRQHVKVPETVTVDDSLVLIELMDERGHALALWPGRSLKDERILSECLTQLYQIADSTRTKPSSGESSSRKSGE